VILFYFIFCMDKQMQVGAAPAQLPPRVLQLIGRDEQHIRPNELAINSGAASSTAVNSAGECEATEIRLNINY
jgi:hypothetical protein